MRVQRRVALVVVAALMMTAGLRGFGQETTPKSTAAKPASGAPKPDGAKEAPKAAPASGAAADQKPKGRLPNNYGKLSLTEEQRTRIYAAQARYDREIESLEAQIAALKQKEAEEISAVLTQEQRTRLEEILSEAQKKKAAAKEKKTAKPAPVAANPDKPASE